MSFSVVAIDHGYPSMALEEQIITRAGGTFVDCEMLPPGDRPDAIQNADALLVRWLRITPTIIKSLRRCKIIIRYGVGTDNVDAEAATEAGIMVGHVPYYCTDEVSNHAIALWMACVRKVVSTHQRLAAGGWGINPAEKMWRSAGRTMGLIGLGNIGQATARKLQGWNMRVLAADPYVNPDRAAALGVTLVDLQELLRHSDYVSLHVPLLPETRHLIGANEFALMKPGAILINTARGPIVDSGALIDALDSGKIAAAALDVFEEEPPPADAPVRKHPAILLTDHVAWYSEESEAELKRTVAEDAVRVCKGGLPLAIANYEVLQRLGRWNEWTPNDTVRWQLKRNSATGS